MAAVPTSSPIAVCLCAPPVAHGAAARGGDGLFARLLAEQTILTDGEALQAGLSLPAMLAQAGAPGLAGLLTALARHSGGTDAEEGGLPAGGPAPPPYVPVVSTGSGIPAGDPTLLSAQGAALLASVAAAQQGFGPAAIEEAQTLAGRRLALAGMDGSFHALPLGAADLAAAGQSLPLMASAASADADSVRYPVPFSAFRSLLPDQADDLSSEGGQEGLETLALSAPPSGQPDAVTDAPAHMPARFQATGPLASADGAAPDIRTPVRAPGWEVELGQKLVWLAGRQSQFAELTLNPPHLGSIEVRLSLSGQEAGAQFFSPHPTVREAIEAAIPRLREMMAQAGLSLGQAFVSPESFRGRHETVPVPRAYSLASHDEAGAPLDLGERPVAGRGLVDLFV